MPKIPLRGCLIPVNSFLIDERCLCLYIHPNKTSANYSLYWSREENPVQHGMTDREVFNVLSKLLEESAEKKPEVAVNPKGIVSAKNKPVPLPIRRVPEIGKEYRQEITVQSKGIKIPPK